MLKGHRGMGAGQLSVLRRREDTLDTWVESGWFEYLRNWDYVDCYCMFMCGVEKEVIQGYKWKNGEMVEGEAHGEGKGKSRRKRMGPAGGQSV